MLLLNTKQLQEIEENKRRSEVRHAWDKFIKEMDPTHWGTLSFAKSVSSQEAEKSFRKFHIKLCSRTGHVVNAIAATEFSSENRIHLHFVTCGTASIPISFFNQKWKAGNRNKIEIFNPNEGMGGAYIVKESLFDNTQNIFFLPDNIGAKSCILPN